jgi:transposase
MRKSAPVRVREPLRGGQEVTFVLAEDSLPPTHLARILWTALGQFDLSPFLDDAKATENRPGRSVYSPRMMLTLWGYALLDGVVHARKIARKVKSDLAYRWIVGDILLEHAAVSAFLVHHREALLELLADVVGTLVDAGLIFLPTHRTAQDGTKVRADAAPGSFRTEDGLHVARERAAAHLQAVLAERDDPRIDERHQLARERSAMDVLDRIQAATHAMEQVRALRAASKDKRARENPAKGSPTDPDCRLMSFADGSIEPGYNVQFATVGDPTGGPVAIVGVRVTQQGNDKGSLMPMRQIVTEVAGVTPTQVLADPDHLTLDELRRAHAEGLEVVSRTPKRWKPTSKEHDAVTRAWMEQAETEANKTLYKGRKALAERPNATFKDRMGLDRMPVRGLNRVECVARLAAVVITLYEFRRRWVN